MFYVFGENTNEAYSVGIADTLEKAIHDWASDRDTPQTIKEEFEYHDPRVVQGEQIHAKMDIKYHVQYIVTK